MARRFEGKVVFITGGSAGIGAATGVAFGREGAKVALTGRNEARLAESVQAVQATGAEALAVPCEVNDRASIDVAIQKTVDAFGALDVVIANAGFGVDGPLAKLTTDDFRRQFDTNVFGAIDTVYAALPHLIKSKGRLGIVSSVLGKIGRPDMSAYAASKFALCGFSESIYYELAPLGVSVTSINPGLVASNFRQTDNTGEFRKDWKDPAPQLFVVPAERAAREIVNALYKRKFEVNVTGHGKIGVWINRHFPWLVRAVLRQISRRRPGSTERATRESTSEN